MILGIGIDLCEVSRVDRLLNRAGERFRQRVFSDGEARYCESHRHPAMHYAARFAAKEAFLKAVGFGWKLGWRELEITRGEEGQPGLKVSGKALEVMAKRGVHQIHLSLSHTRESAVAVVVLEGLGSGVTPQEKS